MAIGKTTEYFTSFDFGPVISIKDRGVTGPATVVIQGIGVGMISCAPTTVLLVACIMGCAALDGSYGVAISAVGMLATLGITLATDAYGPVADNAGGLAEMDPSIPKEVRGKTDALDALGNTTAATGKGFAIASAVLTSLSLMQAFKKRVSPNGSMIFEVDHPTVLSGILLGSMMPMLFAALTMISVGKAAAEIIIEVRRQFREVPGLRKCIEMATEGITIPPEQDVLPESDRCVAISTRSSVKEMVAPGLYAILIPLMVGFTVGPRCLMGVLAGAIASGCMNAIMMSNAGGAWDNSKKLCEKLQIKKSDQGKACVVGDTVGDPFKDTSGPALNILIKLMSMVSLTMAPLIENNDDWENWLYGMAPTAVFLVASLILSPLVTGILGWSDPLKDLIQEAPKEEKKPEKKEENAPVQAAAVLEEKSNVIGL
jgi:inorganic pyrophosphatase